MTDNNQDWESRFDRLLDKYHNLLGELKATQGEPTEEDAIVWRTRLRACERGNRMGWEIARRNVHENHKLRNKVKRQENEIEFLKDKLSTAVDVIEGLADQQEMFNGWYKDDLESIREASIPSISLSPKDSLRFAELMNNPPEPNEALKNLMKEKK